MLLLNPCADGTRSLTTLLPSETVIILNRVEGERLLTTNQKEAVEVGLNY